MDNKQKEQNRKLSHLWANHKIKLAKPTRHGADFLVVGCERDAQQRITVNLYFRKNTDIYPLCELSLRGVTKLIMLLTSILRDLVFMAPSKELQTIARERMRQNNFQGDGKE